MKNINKKGFTTLELIIIIAVIAVLAGVLIPTFVGIVKKANESVDIQLVRQMNTILKTDEPINGKPGSVEEVKEVLASEGIENPTPIYSSYAFAWDSEENVIILLDKENQKGVFPKEYEGVDFKSTWEIFAGSVDVAMEDLGDTLDEAIAKAELGQTIVLSSDQTLSATTLPKNVDIDLGGHKLTLSNGLPMETNSNIVISNGDVESSQITVNDGASLTLNNVDLTATSSCAIFPLISTRVDINGGTILADVVIGTNYSDDISRSIAVNIRNATLGSEADPTSVGIMMITSGDINISGCTIYATEKAIYNRAGNVTVKDTVIYYSPVADYVDTYLGNEGQGSAYNGCTPGSYKSLHWLGGSSGVNAPIVVGDLRAKHYSHDANCTLVNVTVNSTNNTYPDVYLSQERYDVYPWVSGSNPRRPDFNNKVVGTVSVKTTLTCDNTIKWEVNPGNNESFVANATGDLVVFADCAGFEYSNSGHGGVAVLYVDNVFVNGVEQAPGSTSTAPVPAN